MHINYFSVTFWFNIFDGFDNIYENFQNKFSNLFSDFHLEEKSDNLVLPIINAFNDKEYTSFYMSQINAQFTIENTTFAEIKKFQEKTLEIYEFLISSNIKVLHSAVFASREYIDNESLKNLTSALVSSKLYTEDLIDMNLRFGKKEEDLFYKIISVSNKKQLQMPRITDNEGREVPIPLISWYNLEAKDEIIEITFELNDKYLFDHEKDYSTSEFHLNKMLYLLEQDFIENSDRLLKNGEF